MKLSIFSKAGLFILLSMGYVLGAFATVTHLTPVGYWQTIDDHTNKPRSIVKITEVNGKLQGRIIKVYYRPGEGPSDVCKNCTGKFHNQRILGMKMLWGFVKKRDMWRQGRILDPENGKVYRCQMHLTLGGNRLSVRGYIGIPLFGRSEIWNRVHKRRRKV